MNNSHELENINYNYSNLSYRLTKRLDKKTKKKMEFILLLLKL